MRRRPAAADGVRAAAGPGDRRAARRADRGGRGADVGRGLGGGGGRRRGHRRHDRAAAPGRHRDVPGEGGRRQRRRRTTAPGTPPAPTGSRCWPSCGRRCAADDQLVLALQPAVDLATGAPTGVEALIRWRHPRRGWLNPADFIRAVENSELLGAFTRYVLDKALAVAADWARRRAGRADLGQPVGAQPARPAAARRDRRRAAPAPGAAAPAGPGDHRDGGDERAGGDRRGARHAARDGRAARRRRLRHRLLVADLPDPDPGRRAEGRPVLRDPDGRLARGGGDRPDHRRPRPRAGAAGGGRGGGDRRAAGRAGGAGLHRRAGLPLLQADAGGQDRPPCCGSLRDAAPAHVFPLRADGAS